MNSYIKLAITSFTILFLELLLIRLIGTEIRIFAYLSNLILLAIFIGSGLGMLIRKKIPVILSSLLLLIIFLILRLGLFILLTDMLSSLSEGFFWYQNPGSKIMGIVGLKLTIIFFLVIMAIFIPLGQQLGKIFNNTKQTILLYSLDIFMSLLGMWIFQTFSLLQFSPFFGIVFAQILLLVLVEKRHKVYALLFLTLTAGFMLYQQNNVFWSPYQKLTLTELPLTRLEKEYNLLVNNVGYMGLLNLSNSYTQQVTKKFADNKPFPAFDIRFENQYNLPYLLKPNAQNVLIIGAGGGNDIAGALRMSTAKIDAVEIDPKIVELGKKYHPEHPYSSPRVNIIINDGRAFFRTTKKKYDIVIMGLADSHTLNSSLSNLQLDNYLYTQESFKEVKKILKPKGLLFLSFAIRRPWIGGHMQNTLTAVFGHSPLTFDMQNEGNIFGWGGIIFVEDKENILTNITLIKNHDFAGFIARRLIEFNKQTKIVSDNWPYLYLDQPRIPTIHLCIAILLIGVFWVIRKTIPGQEKFNWGSFFLGGGFLLYEFQNISKTALLFGNTWTTNLFTISSILLFLLLANLFVAKRLLSLRFSYFLLFLCLLFQFVVPLATFNSLSIGMKIFLCPLFLNLPLLFSGIIFTMQFNKAVNRNAFFASNLIGSGFGGLLSIVSYLFGLQSLLFISLFLYAFSFIPIFGITNEFKIKKLLLLNRFNK